MAVDLGVFGAGIAQGELVAGDHAESREVLVESFLVVDGVTEILERSVGRERPGRGSPDSFPSDHTSFAFTMATFAARSIDDLGDE